MLVIAHTALHIHCDKNRVLYSKQVMYVAYSQLLGHCKTEGSYGSFASYIPLNKGRRKQIKQVTNRDKGINDSWKRQINKN